ncbi:cytochrome C oxidase subunit IV family protein [Azospirillum sp. ST 5-10]|uniref:cytochrome C oxidase subunit IV family protein n=1 Tax=unclassified Azospirillum TaxID=2630922 RepID=UPI003F4A4568
MTDRLTRAWGILLALCLLTLALGLADPAAPLGLAGTAAVLATTVVKGRQILLDYLELRHAGRGWRVGLTLYLLAVAALILGAYAVAGMR